MSDTPAFGEPLYPAESGGEGAFGPARPLHEGAVPAPETTPISAEIETVRAERAQAIARQQQLEQQLSMTSAKLESLTEMVGNLGQKDADKSPQSQWDNKSLDHVHQILAEELAKQGSVTENEDGEPVYGQMDPSVAAKAIREMASKIVREEISGLKKDINQDSGLRDEYAQVRAEIVDLVGPDINNEKSEIYNASKQEYMKLVQKYGAERVKSAPDFERLAVLQAAQRLGIGRDTRSAGGPSMREGPIPAGVEGAGGRAPDAATRAAQNLASGNVEGYAGEVAKAMFLGG